MTDQPPPDGTPDRDAPMIGDAARRIASGEPVDWPTMESSVSDDESRNVLERLHEVEGIASFHREWRGESAPAGPGAPATWGSLRIVEEIGRGSFGRVYRAWDPGLERAVALKILDPALAADSPYGRSVIDEGRHLARLRHRNIVSIHRAERVDGRVGLEMELITGRTLADIVSTQGPFAADEAALICRDVSRALAAVHKAGLVHRDIKAQNVIREQGGRVVLMDLGAGRPAETVHASGIAGTPLYVAPEVLGGGAPTPKSDLYSLGVLLYYLVTGTFPIAVESLDELRAAHRSGVITRLRDARPDLPERFIHLVERALAPNPEARVDSAGVFEAELSRVLGHLGQTRTTTRMERLWPAAAFVAVGWAIAATVWAFWPGASAPPALAARFTIPLNGHLTIPHGPGSREFAISPDGSSLVYATMEPERRWSHLYHRRRNELESREISREGGQPFFKPDGTRVGAFSTDLIAVSLTGGPPVTVMKGEAAGGGAWDHDGTIVFSSQGNLWRIPETGGNRTQLTHFTSADDKAAIRPHILPSRDILFTLRTRRGLESSVAVLTRGGAVQPLLENATSAKYMPPGYLVYVAGDPPWITAAPFDVGRLAVTGPGTQMQAVRSRTHWFDVSASGTLAFAAPDDPGPRPEDRPRLVWLDRDTGRQSPFEAPLEPGQYNAYSLRLSPDGRRFAFTRPPPNTLIETADIAYPGILVIGDLARGVVGGPLMSQPVHPIAWSADGTRITYRTLEGAIAWRRADGAGDEEVLARPRENFHCNTGEWSPDGRVLLLGCNGRFGAEAHRDVLKLEFATEAEAGKKPVTPQVFVADTPGQGAPRFSPDGRWVAISSNIDGERGARTFVRAFPGGSVHPVTPELSRFPIWRGNEIFLLGTQPLVAKVRTQPAFIVRGIRPVFPAFGGYDALNDGRLIFNASADGRRMLLQHAGQGRGGDYISSLTVVLNWVEEVKAKLGR